MNNEIKTYEINTIADFLKVPTERQADCLQEFASFLSLIRLAQTVGAEYEWVLPYPSDFKSHLEHIGREESK